MSAAILGALATQERELVQLFLFAGFAPTLAVRTLAEPAWPGTIDAAFVFFAPLF